jgi:hypothetical protein
MDFQVVARFGPSGWCSADLYILDIGIRTMDKQEVDHRPVAEVCGVMQAGAGVIESSGNGVDPGPLIQEQIGGRDVTANAGVNECVINDALTIVRPGREA